ncbi:MAG: antibiotic biosynthesis monooxygenase [Burkholderiales bacterium PBB4]|nr:MAG: antibiotic biosynthesis monooxygenase [Burkholderiales bacterium PBB4]
MMLVTGSVVAQVGRVDEAFVLSQAHVARSRAEPGCLAHAVYRDPENDLRLVFLEQWADRASLWEHFKVPASREFANALAALAQQPPSMELFDATPVPVPGKSARPQDGGASHV